MKHCKIKRGTEKSSKVRVRWILSLSLYLCLLAFHPLRPFSPSEKICIWNITGALLKIPRGLSKARVKARWRETSETEKEGKKRSKREKQVAEGKVMQATQRSRQALAASWNDQKLTNARLCAMHFLPSPLYVIPRRLFLFSYSQKDTYFQRFLLAQTLKAWIIYCWDTLFILKWREVTYNWSTIIL